MIEIKTQGVYEFIEKYGADPRFDHENVLSHEAVIKQAYNKGFMDGWNKSRQWIPCSERLPEEEGTYLISRMTYEGYVVDIYPFTPDKELSIEWWTDEFDAWMPLPEPYEESEEK